MIIVTIQDLKTCYTGLTLDYNEASSCRGFEQLCKSDLSQISKCPEDFRLWKLGEFDQDTGCIMLLDVPQLLADGKDFVKGVNNAEVNKSSK